MIPNISSPSSGGGTFTSAPTHNIGNTILYCEDRIIFTEYSKIENDFFRATERFNSALKSL
ncbi:MAG: hypothetical protein K940chlam7_00658 [Chlamydiae bacterium]|nr:hypothetical protein [Chlamydiota bacterium]